MRIGIITLMTAMLLGAAMVKAQTEGGAAPLLQAHAHNDYRHTRPLFDALDQAFTSIEADVHLVEGTLRVGHDAKELTPSRTLESLYLDPLATQVRTGNGEIYPNCERFILLVDIKTDAQPACEQLRTLLRRYAEILTIVENGKVRPGAVQVVISGNRPPLDSDEEGISYFGWDGRLSDLESTVPAQRMPMISDNWNDHFTWKGDGPMPAEERVKLQSIVQKAHSAGRLVRFWGTPENESIWRELASGGVDLIGTDDLAGLAKFLRSEDGRTSRRPADEPSPKK